MSDDEWYIIGLPNLDHLSLFVNYELAFLALAGARELIVGAIGWAARKFF